MIVDQKLVFKVFQHSNIRNRCQFLNKINYKIEIKNNNLLNTSLKNKIIASNQYK